VIDYFDTHAHLQEAEFDADRDAVIDRARSARVSQVVVPAIDLATATSAIDLAERHATLYATAGYHPHEAAHLDSAAIEGIEALLTHPKVVAVGEIGLDFYRLHSTREEQLAALVAMLELAERHSLPVAIHCRDAWPELRPILEPWARQVAPAFAGRPLGVLHYFSSTFEDAWRYHELGFMISIHTSVTHPKADALRYVAAGMPLGSLVIETDSPYGAPQAHRGKRNEPSFVIEAASQIAALQGVSLETVAGVTTANARRLFRVGASGYSSGRGSGSPAAGLVVQDEESVSGATV